MSISTLSNVISKYNPKQKKLDNFLKRASQLRMNATTTNTKAHKLCNLARDKLFNKRLKKMVILQCMMQMTDIIPTKSNCNISKEVLYDLGCGTYNKNEEGDYEYSYEYLFSNIQEATKNQQPVFIMFGMEQYCLIEGVKENFYSTHSTCLFLAPRKGYYDAYYINSHGRDMSDTTNFVRKVSRKRVKTVSFDRPWEFVFLRDLIKYWNSLDGVNIKWDRTPMHTYYDTDLQAGDYTGVCFAFPQMILHHMGEFYTKKKDLNFKWGAIKINSGNRLLLSGELAVFVKSAFTNLNSKYDDTFAKNINSIYSNSLEDPLQITIGEQRTKFIKPIICSLVRYMSQSRW